jgi:hypothetical protein
MEKLRRFYLPICGVLLVIGLAADYFASSVDVVPRDITILVSGQPVTRSTLTYPFYVHVLQLIDIFLYTLAASIFISIFVTNRMEDVRQREKESALDEFRRAINIDVFNALFQMLVPSEIFDAIKEGVINSKVVRKSALWMYDFEVKDQEVVLRQTLSAELHNVGGRDVVDPVRMSIGDFHSTTVLERLTCMLDGRTTNVYDALHPGDNRGVSIKKEGSHQTVELSLTIPPQKHAELTSVNRTRYPTDCVKDCYFSRKPLIGAKLIVTFPDTHCFELFQSFSTEMTLTLDEPRRKVFELKGGILPYQGFQFSLEKKPSNVVGEEPAAVG